MKVENGDQGVRLDDARGVIGDVLRDQVPVGLAAFSVSDGGDDGIGPFSSYAAKIRLVTDLEVNVVEVAELGNDFADEVELHLGQVPVFQRIHLLPRYFADSLNVVVRLHRVDGPEFVVVQRAEEDEFDDDDELELEDTDKKVDTLKKKK